MTDQTNSFKFYSNFLEAINQLDESERANACYEFCKYGITGELPKDKALAMFCVGVSVSIQKYQGRGGNHNPTGKNQHSKKRSKEVKEVKEVKSGQTGQRGLNEQTETETETINIKEKEKEKFVSPDKLKSILKNNFSFNKNKILVSNSLSLLELNDPDIPLYAKEYGDRLILDVQNWLIKNKLGQKVDKQFICRQFTKFASRQRDGG